jgi:hypothetical protein
MATYYFIQAAASNAMLCGLTRDIGSEACLSCTHSSSRTATFCFLANDWSFQADAIESRDECVDIELHDSWRDRSDLLSRIWEKKSKQVIVVNDEGRMMNAENCRRLCLWKSHNSLSERTLICPISCTYTRNRRIASFMKDCCCTPLFIPAFTWRWSLLASFEFRDLLRSRDFSPCGIPTSMDRPLSTTFSTLPQLRTTTCSAHLISVELADRKDISCIEQHAKSQSSSSTEWQSRFMRAMSQSKDRM